MKVKNILFGSLLLAPVALRAQPPAAAAILDKFVQVTGGAAAYKSVRTLTSSGRVDYHKQGGGVSFNTTPGTVNMYQATGGRSSTEINVPSFGGEMDVSRFGTDGATAYMMSRNGCGGGSLSGVMTVSGDERAFAVRTADPQTPANWKNVYTNFQVAGAETVGGKQCTNVVMTPKEGSPETNCYDTQSGLLLRTQTNLRISGATVPVSVTYQDYKKEGPIVVPHQRAVDYAGQTTTYTFSRVQVNASIPPAKLAVPAEVRGR